MSALPVSSSPLSWKQLAHEVKESGFYPKSPPPSPRAFGGGSVWSFLDFQMMALVVTSKWIGAGGQNGTRRPQGGGRRGGSGDR